MSIEILAGIFILFSMAALGAPVAYAILSGIIVYLGVAGQDLAIAGQTMVPVSYTHLRAHETQ